MLKRMLAAFLAVVMLCGMGSVPALAQEAETTKAAQETEPETVPVQETEVQTVPVQETEPEVTEAAQETQIQQTPPQEIPVRSESEVQAQAEGSTAFTLEGGTAVALENQLFSAAVKGEAGQSLSYSFSDFSAADGDMLLLSFAVKGESVCSEFTVTIDFSGTDTVMKYYAPVQWSRVYMPVVCSGSLSGVTIQVKTGAVLVGEATVENKLNTPIEDLKLQSGMWMLDDYQEVVLDADYGVRNVNQEIYDAAGLTTSHCIDLVISSCGNFIYSIGGGYLTVTDVSDPANPRVRSIFNNSDYPTDYGDTRQIALLPNAGKTGDAVMFTGRISGAFIVDVSDPDNPVECAHYDAQEMATGIATYEDYAFIANRQYGVEVVDVSDLYNPVHLGVVARGGEVQSCKVVDGILYCGRYDKNVVELYDVTDVVNPKLLGSAKLDGHGDGMTVATIDGRTYLYAGTGHHSATNITHDPLTNLNYGNGNGLDIFDVTDPANPVLLSVSKNDGRFCHSKCDYWGAEVAIKDGRVYVYLLTTYNGVHIYDATDPAAPVRLAHVTLRVDRDSPNYSNGNMGHTSTVYPVIFQYDPEEYKQAPMGAMTVYEGALYLAGVYTDLHVYETDLAHPLVEDTDPVQVSFQTPYYNAGLVSACPGGQTVAVADHGNYMYVAGGSQGILIYSKDLKTLHKTVPVEDVCYDLYIQDGILYTAEGRNGAAVYTIGADGLTLTQTKRYISDVDLVTTVRPSATGKFIALSVGSTTGEIVDISATPKRVVRCSTSTQAYHHFVEVTANGRYVVFWGLSGYEQWYDFGANDSNATPQKVISGTVRSRAALAGGYTAYKGNTIIQTRGGGYVYYDPTTMTAAQIEELALNHVIRPVTSFGSTTKTSIYGRGLVYENLLITCDRVYGRVYITDISDLDNPVLLKSWTGLKGTPDIPTVVDKTLYIPMGYEGIMTVDLSDYLEPHIHCECGGNAQGLGSHTACSDIRWTPISEALKAAGMTAKTADFGKLPSGNYYLDTDVVVTGISSIGTMADTLATTAKTTRNIKLCLNGHNITTTKTKVFGELKIGSSLAITDCTELGTVYGGNAPYGQVIYTHAGSTLNIYGGNFTSNNTATTGGVVVIACDGGGDLDGDGDYDETDKKNTNAKSTFNFYGGRIYGGKAGSGGNVVVFHVADMYMYGGTIEDGAATSVGGNLIHYSTGNLNIYGGVIKNGTSKTYGGNIVNNSGTMRIYGGSVEGGTAATYGGNIHNAKTFYMYGGTVTGGSAGNNAGGNLMVGSAATFNMYGGTIENGAALTAYGGNVQVLGKAYLCGGTIQNGAAKFGGNIGVYNKGILYNVTSTNTREPVVVQYGTATGGQGSNIYVAYSSATNPTLSLTWGTYRGGSIYVGPNAKASISGNPVITDLDISSGRTVTFGTLTEGARIALSMENRTGNFGTGTEATLSYLTAPYAMTHTDGTLALVAPESLQLSYDDRKNLSDLIGTAATNVTVSDQVVTSKQIGTEIPDTAVLTYDSATDTLYAVGTGTASLNVNGKTYPVTVKAAPLSLFMITGHSIGEGYLADGTQSVACEAGQVYGSFGREALTSAEGGLGYGSAVRAGGEGTHSLDVYAPGNGGTQSPASGLAWQWNQLTGEKVWVINTAVAGSCINEWLPGATNHSGRYTDYFNTAVVMYSYAQQILSYEIAAGHYTLGHQAVFYFGGANFKWYEGWTQEKLESDYAAFWDTMKSKLDYDMDGDGKTETVEALGFVPVFAPSANLGYQYDKAAQFYMAASADYPDMFMALNYRSWIDGVENFPEIEYTTQSGIAKMPESVWHTKQGGTSDESIFCANDKTHHSQIGYNAIGTEIAKSLYAWLEDDSVTSGTLHLVDGTAEEDVLLNLGETVSLVPVIAPVYGNGVEVTVTGELEISYPMVITATGYAGGAVTISANGTVLDTVEVSVRPLHKHCVCGGNAQGLGDHTQCEDVVWTPISTAFEAIGLTAQTADFGKLPSGNYYLDVDVVVTGNSAIGATASSTATTASVVKDIKLCLNGHDITTTRDRVFGNTRIDSSLSIADCIGSGTVYGGKSAYGQIIYTHAASTLNIYGGNFTSLNTATTGGLIAVACETCGDQDGDGDYDTDDRTVAKNPSVFNLYGGKLYGGKAENAGNVVVFHTGVMNMYGGTVTGGSASILGGNLVTYSTGMITLYGGEVSEGSSATYAGNIYMSTENSKLDIRGCTVKNGTAKTYGGNIVNNKGTLRLYSGSVEGGTAATYAGNIHNAKTFYMYGGTVTGGSAGNNSGGNVMVATGSNFNMYGGTIQNGTASTAYGGNVQVLGTAYLCGGTIQNGTAKFGGNICVYNKGILYNPTSVNTREPQVVRGGTATGGLGSNIYVGYSSATNPTANLTWGTFEDGTVYVGPNGKANISGNPVISELSVGAGRSITVGTLTEGAKIGISAEDSANAFGTGTQDAVLYLYSTDSAYTVTHKDGSFYLAASVAETDGKTYATLAQAIANTQSYVKLLRNVTEDVTVSGEVYLDLNGFTLAGSISGEGTLYGMDSTGDEYALPAGRITGTVSCKVAGNFKTNATGQIKRYMAIADETGYTFHRVYVGVTHMSLKPTHTGVGYKAVFAADEAVQALLAETETYGFILWVGDEGEKHTFSRNADSFTSGDPLTLRLQNFDVAGYGETKVYGQVFMKLADGTVIESATYSYTLRELLETVASNIGVYDAVKITALQKMIADNADAMKDWNIDSIRNYTAQTE